jgi:hypothetical protein
MLTPSSEPLPASHIFVSISGQSLVVLHAA